MENCKDCSKQYCLSCGAIDECHNGCKYNLAHTFIPSIAGNEWNQAAGSEQCARCYLSHHIPEMLESCDSDCQIYGTVCVSRTIWNCTGGHF